MSIEAWAAVIGIVLVVAGNLVVLSMSYGGVKNEIKSMRLAQAEAVADRKEAYRNFEDLHKLHFVHANKPEIHQEALSKGETLLHIQNATMQVKSLSEQIKDHAKDDMDVFKEIRDDMREIKKAVKVL